MKEYRCKKIGGKLCPKSCHVLNGRKSSCEDMMEIELEKKAMKARIPRFQY